MKKALKIDQAELLNFAGFMKVLLSIKGYNRNRNRSLFIVDFLNRISNIDVDSTDYSADDVAKFKVNYHDEDYKKLEKILAHVTDDVAYLFIVAHHRPLDKYNFFNIILRKVAELLIKEIKQIKDIAEIIPIYKKACVYFIHYADNLGPENYGSFNMIDQEIINILENEAIDPQKHLTVVNWFIEDGWTRFNELKNKILLQLNPTDKSQLS